eukprot:g822.t1
MDLPTGLSFSIQEEEEEESPPYHLEEKEEKKSGTTWTSRRSRIQDVSRTLHDKNLRTLKRQSAERRFSPEELIERARKIESSFESPHRSKMSRPYVISNRQQKYQYIPRDSYASLSDRIGRNYSTSSSSLSMRAVQRARDELEEEEEEPHKKSTKSPSRKKDPPFRRPTTTKILHRGKETSRVSLLDRPSRGGAFDRVLSVSPKRSKMSRDAVAARWAPEPMTFEKECRDRETPETNKVPTQKEIDSAKSEFRKHARKMLVAKPFKLSYAWMENIESRVGRVLKFKSCEDFDEDSAPDTMNLLELNEEIQDGYRFAQRCASLMYDLRDPIERDELSIDYDAIVYGENWLRRCENPHSTFDWKVLRICPDISHESLLSHRDRMDVVHKILGTYLFHSSYHYKPSAHWIQRGVAMLTQLDD